MTFPSNESESENNSIRSRLPERLQCYEQAEPEYFGSFRCLGADCPDTCCQGWGVAVDKRTFEKYRQCSDPVFEPLFRELVTINTSPTERNYASIQLKGDRCPFLSEKLCAIQKGLGEDHLSYTCATFPRIIQQVFGRVERSLDLSCPEAARLALTDPRPIHFLLSEADAASCCQEGPIDAKAPERDSDSWETRRLVIAILQDRRYPLSKRLLFVAQLCDLLSARSSAGHHKAVDILYGFRDRMESGGSHEEIEVPPLDHGAQLELVLELINARIRIDFVSQCQLDLFREFASGIQLEVGSDRNQAARRYAQAWQEYYAPFMKQHEYMLENYLVAYVYKTVFPLLSSKDCGATDSLNPAHQCIIMVCYFLITKAVMIGISGKYKTSFGIDHVVRCVQSTSRALEHCGSYAPQVLQILASKGIVTAEQMVVVTGSADN